MKLPRLFRRLPHLGGARGWAAVFFGHDRLELATARLAGGEVHIGVQTTAAVSAEETDPTARWRAAAATLRPQFDPQEYHIITAIGAEDVFCQMVRLPTAEPTELQQMLDLQIDNLMPLPADEAVYGYEPLETSDGQTLVLVAIARKEPIHQRLELLEAAGMSSETVSVDVWAVFRALLQRELLPRDERQHTLVLLTSTAVHLVLYRRGVPVAIRSLLLGAEGLDTAAGQAALQAELRHTLLAVNTTAPPATPGRLMFVSLTEAMQPVVAQAAQACGGECLTNGALPSGALSLCLEAAGSPAPLNLLPPEWRQRRRRRLLRRNLIRAGVALAVLYLGLLAAFGTVLAVRQTQLRQVRAEIKRLDPAFRSARALHSEMLTMRKQMDTKYSALEILRDVAVRRPDNVQINAFLFRKDQQLVIRGQAQTSALALEFISRLEQSELFAAVKTQSMNTPPGGGLTKFEAVCTIKSAATTGAPTWR